MTVPLLKKKRLVTFAIEATPGVVVDNQTLTVNVEAPTMTDETEMIESNYTSVTGGSNTPDRPGEPVGKFTFTTELVVGAGGVPASLAALLNAAGLVKGDNGYYAAAMSLHKQLSMNLYEDGRVKRMCGCAGDVKIKLNRGETIAFEFEFTGVWLGEFDAAMPVIEAPTQKALVASTWTLDGEFVAITKEAELALNNTVTSRGDHYVITSKSPELTLDPEAALVGTYDYQGKKATETLVNFNTEATNAEGGAGLTVGQGQIVKIEDGDRDDIALDSLTVKCKESAAGYDSILLYDTIGA